MLGGLKQYPDILIFKVRAVALPPVPFAGIVMRAALFVPPKGELVTVAFVTVELYVIGTWGPPVLQQFGPPEIPL